MFNIGDRVKIINYGGVTDAYPIGWLGTVIDVDYGGYILVLSDNDSPNYPNNDFAREWPCNETELELIAGAQELLESIQ